MTQDIVKVFRDDSVATLNREMESFIDQHNKKGYEVVSFKTEIGTGSYNDKLDRVIVTVHMKKTTEKSKSIV